MTPSQYCVPVLLCYCYILTKPSGCLRCNGDPFDMVLKVILNLSSQQGQECGAIIPYLQVILYQNDHNNTFSKDQCSNFCRAFLPRIYHANLRCFSHKPVCFDFPYLPTFWNLDFARYLSEYQRLLGIPFRFKDHPCPNFIFAGNELLIYLPNLHSS